ncbi:putative lipid II flippase FtsW [Anaeromyxobacter paludicola]|uniref:Probable peptidoglycan glycosyltransferase FtsW n=1 Tax=Anaeromyxobacter paludicola TaxID=2918171 RepID=A0ABN6NCV7_9BACT|nr:putative lipid II flippase FtsW [Anaeromyxobacter paludicola]BDG10306.1 putative lipid II flippase FtsW [Anaeromyxobacter paludicola]
MAPPASDRSWSRRPSAAPVDGWLLFAVLALTAFGAVMVYSASAVTAAAKSGDQFFFLKRQLVAAAVGAGLLVGALKLGYRRFETLAYPVLLFTLFSLVLVLVPGIGKVAGGARRWIGAGPLSFQPAELCKLALVLYLARSLAYKRDKMRLFSIGFVPHVMVAGVLMVLCLFEKDLGTCVVLAGVLLAMLFAAGAKVTWLVAAVFAAIPIGWKLIAGTDYRLKRWLAFKDPFAYRDGVGFQMVESLLGVGNGGWLGQGLGDGKGKLFYLPAAHTDFIGAVIAEELGLVGMLLLVTLYGVFVWRGLKAAFGASDSFGCYLALGLTTLVGVQAVFNLCVVLVLLPTKGLTLPFVSYGGSSLMTLMGASGLLLSVSQSQGGFLRRGAQAVRLQAEVAP